MKAIFWKEAREKALWALLGLLVISGCLCLALTVVSHRNDRSFGSSDIHTFMSESVQLTMIYGCPAIGLMLGFLATIGDSRRDRWGFLVHRPIRRQAIFAGKAFAGLLLYVLATAIPWLCAAGWAAWPGHLAAPFLPQMLLPGVADITIGMAWFFAGMLIGIRQARWWGSRLLPLGLVLIVSLAATNARTWAWAMVIASSSVLTLLLAAWGSFLVGGATARQPLTTRWATGVSLIAGLWVVLWVCAMIPCAILTIYEETQRYSYAMDRNGNPVLVTEKGWYVTDISDLSGKTISGYNGKYRRRYSDDAFLLDTDGFYAKYTPFGYHWEYSLLFPLCSGQVQTNAYYVHHNRLIWYYDQQTRLLTDRLGANGWESRTTSLQPFLAKPVYIPWYSDFIYEDGVYHLFYSPEPGQLSKVWTPDQGEVVLVRNSMDVNGRTKIVLLTNRRLLVFSCELLRGLEVDWWNQPLAVINMPQDVKQAREVTYGWGGKPGERLAVLQQDESGQGKAFQADVRTSKVDHLVDLPALHKSTRVSQKVQYQIGAFLWPWMWTVNQELRKNALDNPEVLIASACWLVFGMMVCQCLLARYQRNLATKITWAGLSIALGPVTVLTMLCLRDWPARERCEGCGKMRAVDQMTCGHCQAAWPAVRRDGTEVLA
ncbi:MAG: ABC transporter permease [Phycisphaeraceae bacterium]|nr:ABC transporter permease [Phycisphaeraceae bacterium]